MVFFYINLSNRLIFFNQLNLLCNGLLQNDIPDPIFIYLTIVLDIFERYRKMREPFKLTQIHIFSWQTDLNVVNLIKMNDVIIKILCDNIIFYKNYIYMIYKNIFTKKRINKICTCDKKHDSINIHRK